MSIRVPSSLTKVTLECSDNTKNVPEKLILPKESTQVDKYKQCNIKHGKHTRIVLDNQHNRTFLTKKRFLSINVPPSMTKITLYYSENPRKTHQIWTPQKKLNLGTTTRQTPSHASKDDQKI